MDKIVCVGKNYLEHAKELGDAVPAKPVLFLKPPSVLVHANLGETVRVDLPKGRGAVHHECEIVLKLGRLGQIEAVSLGLDMTLRDVQAELKKQGHPWTVAKVFSGSAIVGPFIPVDTFSNYLETPFSFSLDGSVKQKGVGTDMSLTAEECVGYAHSFFPLKEGDLLFTGTPVGVGPVKPGQLGKLEWGKLNYHVQW